MSVAEWTDAYGIHHWRILWSSYRKLAWVEFEFNHWILFRHSNQLSYEAKSPTCTQSQLCTPTPVSLLLQCQISFWLLPSSVAKFILIRFILKGLSIINHELISWFHEWNICKTSAFFHFHIVFLKYDNF